MRSDLYRNSHSRTNVAKKVLWEEASRVEYELAKKQHMELLVLYTTRLEVNKASHRVSSMTAE